MAQSNFSTLRKQAQYIDEVITNLDSKLADPGSIFRFSKVPHTEKILDNIMAENEGILQSINEEREIAEHSFQEQENFLHRVNEDVLIIINEQRNIEEQLEQYGYIPMPETPTALQKSEGTGDAIVDEYASNDAACFEKQLEGISLGNYAGTQYRSPQPTRPLEPVFSKYCYQALGMPVPPVVLNTTVNRTYN